MRGDCSRAFDDTDFSDMLCNFDHVTMLCRAPTCGYGLTIRAVL